MLGASAAPAGEQPDMSDAQIYTIVHLNSHGVAKNGHDAELARCWLTSDAWRGLFGDLYEQFDNNHVYISSYAGYQTVKEMNLDPDTNEDKAAAIFVALCRNHNGAPHRDA